MASIQVRKESGCLIVDFYYQGKRCREQTALKDSTPNRKRLEKLLERVETEITAGTFDYAAVFPASKIATQFTTGRANPTGAANHLGVPHPSRGSDRLYLPNSPLFSEFAETWLSEKLVEWRISYQTCIREVLNRRLIPEFGSRKLAEITKTEVLAYRASLAKPSTQGRLRTISNSRINRIMNVLGQIMNESASRYDFRSPFESVKQLRVKRSDVHPFTMDEVAAILAKVRPDFRDYYTVRFFTGMRTGEIDGLKWKYVDFEHRLILVRETVVSTREEYTKTDASQRDIHMSQLVFDALSRQKQATGKLNGFVFCSGAGTPMDHKNVTNRVWYPILRHLNIPRRRPYQTRHTAATLWLGAGENPEWIARQMGHSTTEMLFRVYSRFVPNLTRRDGTAFERLLAPIFGVGSVTTSAASDLATASTQLAVDQTQGTQSAP